MEIQYLESTLSLEKTKNYCGLLYRLTQIPLILLDHKKQPVYILPDVDLLKKLNYQRTNMLPHHKKISHLPFLSQESEIFTYGCQPFVREESIYFLFMGPCFLKTVPSGQLAGQSLFEGLSLDETAKTGQYMPQVRTPYLRTVLQMFFTLLSGSYIHTNDIMHYNSSDSFEDLPVSAEKTLFQRLETAEFHTPYAYEKRQMDVIRQGDVEKVSEIMDNMTAGKPGILSRNALRHSKNLLIAGVTLATRAAMDGGVPEERAYAMSDSFIQKSEDCIDINAIEELNQKMYYDFALEVNRQKKEQIKVSAPIEKAVSYIYKHLHYDLTLDTLSRVTAVSPSQFSRTFKKEIGISFVDFVQKERIQAAQNMLRFSDYSLSEISSYLNFSSQSYFTEIFKKFTGVTPLQFRKRSIVLPQ